MITLCWAEIPEAGPTLEFLCQVADMGEARDLARQAWTDTMPEKSDRLPADDPDARVAARHPGELLWRVEAPGPRQPDGGRLSDWQIGAAAARAYREADVAAYHRTRDAALNRRHKKRGAH
jgi:hypothetical protein